MLGCGILQCPHIPLRGHAGPALLPCLSKLAPPEPAVINGVFLSVLRGPHYGPLMLRFALSTVTELNDGFSQVTGEGQWIGPRLEETNEIFLQPRALIKSRDQFGRTKEIVLGCWCVNERRGCGSRKGCVRACFSCSVVLHLVDTSVLVWREKPSIFLPAVPRTGQGQQNMPGQVVVGPREMFLASR